MKSLSFKTESLIMRFFRQIKMDHIAWSLRRLYCPVDKNALVLEVGSGGSPYFRSNVLCDAHEVSQERFFVPLIHDRPTVIAFVENLPFQDNSFDFVIASHVLEHSSDPDKFISELQRVAKAGYIEVPDAFMERLTHYNFHKLEITDKDNQLIIRKKKHYIEDAEVVDLFHNKARPIFPIWAGQFPFHFHVRYYWEKACGGIKYKVLNPECSTDWEAPVMPTPDAPPPLPFVAAIKQKILSCVRRVFSQNKRNSQLDVLSLMKCIKCSNTQLKRMDKHVVCQKCSEKYFVYLPDLEPLK